VDYRFNARVDDILKDKELATGVRLANDEEIMGDHIILAIGHSARDTIETLHKQGIEIEAKDFAAINILANVAFTAFACALVV